jgi:hypothetical protein
MPPLKIGSYTLPDPDVIGQAEYRALWEHLDCNMLDEHSATAVPEAIYILEEMRDWCASLITDITHGNGGE